MNIFSDSELTQTFFKSTIIGSLSTRIKQNNMKEIKAMDVQFFNEIKCKFRVLDRHGTDPWFNDDEIVEKSGFKNTLGGLGLPTTRQILTLYPQSHENDWIGLILYPFEDYTTRNDRTNVLVQARNKETVSGNEEMLAKLGKHVDLHFTVADVDFDLTGYGNATNHG